MIEESMFISVLLKCNKDKNEPKKNERIET